MLSPAITDPGPCPREFGSLLQPRHGITCDRSPTWSGIHSAFEKEVEAVQKHCPPPKNLSTNQIDESGLKLLPSPKRLREAYAKFLGRLGFTRVAWCHGGLLAFSPCTSAPSAFGALH